jgi:hypothetical protein
MLVKRGDEHQQHAYDTKEERIGLFLKKYGEKYYHDKPPVEEGVLG